MCKESMIEWSRDNNGAKSLVSPASSNESHKRATRKRAAIAPVSAGLKDCPRLAKEIRQFSSMVGSLSELSGIWRSNSFQRGEIISCGRVWKRPYEKTDFRSMLSLARLTLSSLRSIAFDTSCGQIGFIISTPMLDRDDVIDLGCILSTIATHIPISTKYL